MMKVLHSADWHLGAPMARWGDDARQALASVPDYKFDQQRSRRKPLDYLEKQYSEWFVLENKNRRVQGRRLMEFLQKG